MHIGRTVFAQLMDFVPSYEFRQCVEHYNGNYKVKSFSCWDQFLCMAFAQWDLSLRSRGQEWEAALLMGVHTHFPQSVRGAGLKLISDNGSQPTSTGFLATTSLLGIEQISTSYENPKGNAETERLMRSIKEELLWLREFTNLEDARAAIRQWIEGDYNQHYVHSSLGYMSPVECARAFRPLELLPAAA